MLHSTRALFLLLGVTTIAQSCDVPSLTTASGTHAPKGTICPGQLIFDEEFNVFDLKIWQHERTLNGGGNGEFQWYDNSRLNSYVADGALHIRPTLVDDLDGTDAAYYMSVDINGGSAADECTDPKWNGCLRTGSKEVPINPVKSARIRTLDSFAFKYGKVEIRAKNPQGDWLWPSLWMLPKDNQYAKWPCSGEIDIMESRGNANYTNSTGHPKGNQLMFSTLHWGPRADKDQYQLTHWEKINNNSYHSDFHLYKLEWTKDHIAFTVDDEEIGRVTPPDGGFWELGKFDELGGYWDDIWRFNSKMAPFDQEFYLIINVAVGATNSFFSETFINGNGDKPWKDGSNTTVADFYKARNTQWLPTWKREENQQSHFLVDYVKVWAL